MKVMFKRLSYRLIFFLTILVVLIEAIAGYHRADVQKQQLIDAMVLGADQLSRGIISSTWQAMLADHREAAYEIMQTVAHKQGIKRIRIFNKEGRIMFSTAVDDSGQVDIRAEACYMCHASEQPLVKVEMPTRARLFTGSDNQRALALVTPIYNEPSCSEAACHAHPRGVNVLGVLDVALDAEPVEREVAAMQQESLIVTGLSIVLIAFLIFIFSKRFVDAPIQKLIDGARTISAMQLDKPIHVETTAELGELAQSFNIMRERLHEAMTELNQLTQSLEAKVEERTRQLNDAHKKLVQTDRMVSLGQLCASVAHEINNPVSGVLNFSMLMQRIMTDEGVPPQRVKEFQNYLGRVVTETSRVGRIVSDLLSFSRRSKPKSEPHNLNRLIESTLTVISHKMKLMGVVVEKNLDPNLPPVPCDGSQIQQVVINLVMNGAEAFHHAQEDKKVVVRTSVAPGTESVMLEIRDNGEGIQPEHLSKIFDPFFTTKEEGKGVGLGLPVVYGIIESHGGDIEVKTEVGKGTAFFVTLPLSRTQTETSMTFPSADTITRAAAEEEQRQNV